MISLFVLSCLSTTITIVVNAEPSHMRLALGLTPSHMNVAWDTYYDNSKNDLCDQNAVSVYLSRSSPSILMITHTHTHTHNHNNNTTQSVTYNLVGSTKKFKVSSRTTLWKSDPSRNFTIHDAVLPSLAQDSTYSYVVGNPSCGYSEPHTFRTRRTSYPQTHVLLGDMGAAFA